MLTTKSGDTVCAKYCQAKPRVTIDGIRADLSQVKLFSPSPPKEKKKRVAQPIEGQEEKHNWITIGVVQKKTNDLLKYIQTLEKKIDHEMLECLELQDKLDAFAVMYSIKNKGL